MTDFRVRWIGPLPSTQCLAKNHDAVFEILAPERSGRVEGREAHRGVAVETKSLWTTGKFPVDQAALCVWRLLLFVGDK